MLEHLTLRDFSGIDRDLPFPELPQLKAVHFYHRRERYRGDTRWGDPDWWESRVPCCITKSLLEKLPSLRTLAHHGDCGRCLPDVFEPVQDVLQALAWVDGEPYYYDHKTPDINCLRRLRHIKIGFYESYFWDGTRPRSLCDGKALPRMESLETVEVIARRRQPSGEGIIIPFRRMVETFSSSKNAGGFKSLRVVDLRSFGLWNFSTAKWKAMKDEFLDTEIREYRELGINLLLPEAAGCS
ncbi:hypothetical protein LX32DRAFT_640148 [Colletotrichum zoysiae]|uniref:Uncharacterized protein n=1 Tax=Colletotrichum zoysiae TaxID=1216348 RepID=A0AAD9M0M9_9PEZI|nr:hypothetical protein LX32DRAFT_640148 [Colletotrichum zoysiae]